MPAIAIAIAAPHVGEFSHIAKPFYDEFFRMGILHKTPESAGEFLNRLSVTNWWKSVQASGCVQEFVKMFCNTDTSRLRSLDVARSS
jgi:hypothetical protein